MTTPDLISNLSPILGESRLLNDHQLAFKCPFCHHHKFKLEINLEKLVWHCWVCHSKGKGIPSLLRKVGRGDLSKQFRDFKPKLRLDIDFSNDIRSLSPHIQLPENCNFILNGNSPEVLRARKYLYERGIEDAEFHRYNIQFCSRGLFRNRIIVPSYTPTKRLVNFIGRAIYASDSKYLEPKVNKNTFIGFENQINWNLPVTLVEGVFDAIAVSFNAIPLFGTELLSALKLKLLETDASVNICLDSDARRNAIIIAEELLDLGLDVNLVTLPDGEDPSSLGFTNAWKYINQAKTVDYFELIKLRLNG